MFLSLFFLGKFPTFAGHGHNAVTKFSHSNIVLQVVNGKVLRILFDCFTAQAKMNSEEESSEGDDISDDEEGGEDEDEETSKMVKILSASEGAGSFLIIFLFFLICCTN